MGVTSSVNIGSAELGAPLCLAFPPSNMEKVAPSKHYGLIGILIFIVILLLGILGILGIYTIKSGILKSDKITTIKNANEYSWQVSCDSQCAEKVGKAAMAMIDVGGCNTFILDTEMMGMTNVDKNYLAAIDDKMESIHCFDYDWLRTCDKSCAKTLGVYSLSILDEETNCQMLMEQGKLRQQTRVAFDESKNTLYFKALADRLNFLHCKP